MTCKLSRRNKKHISMLMKTKNIFSYRNILGLPTTNRSRNFQLRTAVMKNLKNRFNYEFKYDEVQFYNKSINVHGIRENMVLTIPRYATSIVKRSRIKNFQVGFYGISLQQYNENSGKNMNPVSMYFYIKSREEHNGL